jgi:CrcB protein
MRALLVGVGGFIGSVLRYWLSGAALATWPGTTLPVGTIFVNVLGCLIIGILAGVADARGLIGPDLRAFLFTGILGGFTTFSAFALETMNLSKEGAMMSAALNVGISIVFGLAAAWAGRAVCLQLLR